MRRQQARVVCMTGAKCTGCTCYNLSLCFCNAI
jgi:hypothetical protein